MYHSRKVKFDNYFQYLIGAYPKPFNISDNAPVLLISKTFFTKLIDYY